MKKTSGTFVTLCLMVSLFLPSLCFGGGIDGVLWGKMDETQKALVVMGYKMGSLDAVLALNALIALSEEAKNQRKTDKNAEMAELNKISDAKFAGVMNLIRRFLVRETYIPEEDIEKIVKALDAFYLSKTSLTVPLSEAISKIREEMYKNNPGVEKALKANEAGKRKQDK